MFRWFSYLQSFFVFFFLLVEFFSIYANVVLIIQYSRFDWLYFPSQLQLSRALVQLAIVAACVSHDIESALLRKQQQELRKNISNFAFEHFSYD